ncbi:hypothetical protein F9Z84_06575 [Escherichia coli]|nr:hypothetical protein F9Z84_06575 [Escherichia coli]
MGWLKGKILKLALRFEIQHGTTRTVFLIGKYAFKIPIFKNGYRAFVRGILGNVAEASISKCCPNYFLPVVWSLPFGLLVVMPRVKPIRKSTWYYRAFMADLFHQNNDNNVEALAARDFCETAWQNYALYKGKPVCIDYGTNLNKVVNENDWLRELDFFVSQVKETVEKMNHEQIDVSILVPEKSYQGDLDALDIPVFAPHVESKNLDMASEVDASEGPSYGQVPWEEVCVGELRIPRVVPYNRFTRRLHAKRNRLRLPT